MNESQQNLFSVADADPFVAALEKYGIWPTTVWDCNFSDPTVKQMKTLIGDRGQSRPDCLAGTLAGAENSVYRGRHVQVDGTFGFQQGASIFNPAVASWILNMYAPKTGTCFDPFGGGGTRAIMAAKSGLEYVGMELRAPECLEVKQRCENAGVLDKVEIICGDSRYCNLIDDKSADFLITCPPYWNLEQYDGGDGDLSMCLTYADFLMQMELVVAESYRILKGNSFSVWVVGIFRGVDGELLPMHHDIARIHREQGFSFKEEIILSHKNNGAIQRVGNFEKGNKFLIRTHEYALVFIR